MLFSEKKENNSKKKRNEEGIKKPFNQMFDGNITVDASFILVIY